MKMTIEVEIPEEQNAICIPFDNGDAGRYRFGVHPDQPDQVSLRLDREACKSFVAIFAQLAYGDYKDFHVHMALDETPLAQCGFRIELA